ncbi:LPD7 domain-containing protein [Paraburkholderia sp. BCC1885]|uniref:LPD7 domain-containing protein n=1 Tax=Paraburkholderia sp. BCC1885 TaxID=2562669 RepID=UPI00164239D8|nr:LPD7 domain-containing protein [Paraburkholderia sp. BCC1885]
MADNLSSSDAEAPESGSAPGAQPPDVIPANVIERDDDASDPGSAAPGREDDPVAEGLDPATLEALAARRRRDADAARAHLGTDARGWDQQSGPPSASPAAAPQAGDTRRPGGPPDQDAAARAAGVLDDPPELVKKRYLRAGHQYFLKDEPHHLAFEDSGMRLVTGHNRADIVESMVEMTAAKGWHRIRVSGHEEFRREVWLQASLRGIEVRGYEPKAVDRARLDELRKSWMHNRIEPEPPSQTASQPRGAQTDSRYPREPAPDAPGPGPVPTGPSRGPSGARQERRPLQPSAPRPASSQDPRPASPDPLDGVRPVNRAGRDAVDAERQARETVRVGQLLDHGAAPYQHDRENSDSYYAVVLNRTGKERIVWGVDLERAIEEGNANIGDTVSLENLGKRWVTVEIPMRDAAGKVVDVEEKEVYRNTWQVDVLERTKARDTPGDTPQEARPAPYRETSVGDDDPGVARRAPDRTRDGMAAGRADGGDGGRGAGARPAPQGSEVPAADRALQLAVIMEAMREQGFSEKSVAKVQARAGRVLDTLVSQGVTVPAPRVFDPKAPSERARTVRKAEPQRARDRERAPAAPDPSMPGL